MKIDLVSAVLGGALGYAAVKLRWLDPLLGQFCALSLPDWLSPVRKALCPPPLVLGAPPPPVPTPAPSVLPPPSPILVAAKDCPRLDTRLAEVQWTSNPGEKAAALGIPYRSGTVRVVVELGGATPDRLASLWGFQLESLAGNVATGWVPTGVLCGLSQTPGVLSVRPG